MVLRNNGLKKQKHLEKHELYAGWRESGWVVGDEWKGKEGSEILAYL